MKGLFIIVLMMKISQLIACGDAYQLRLFPIGTSNNNIIVIETSLNRYWGPDTVGATLETRDNWRGIITLKSMDKAGIFTTIKTVDSVDFLDRDYINELKIYFTKAYTVAKSLNNFKKAENQIIEFCNFKTDCLTVDLMTDSINNVLSVITNEKRVINIQYPQTIIEESESTGGIKGQTFKINSIRKIKMGDISLIVVDCASGDGIDSEIGKQRIRNQQQCSSPVDCIYPEIVLYHGISFDTIIWN